MRDDRYSLERGLPEPLQQRRETRRVSLEAIIAIGFFALIAVETAISWRHNLRTYETQGHRGKFCPRVR